MAKNGIERLLGKIDQKLDDMDKKQDNFRNDIKENYEQNANNRVSVAEAHRSIEGIKDDLEDNIRPAIQSAQNKGVATGGLGILTGFGLFLKNLLMEN